MMLDLGNSRQQCGGEDKSVQAFVLSSSSGLSSTYLLQVRFVLYAEMCVTGSGSERHASQLLECKTLRLGHELTFLLSLYQHAFGAGHQAWVSIIDV